jgi:UDP:flavonoid glycosyltransferase YjiC (YdhE family)
MATILAYTSPALGHLLPISALMAELVRRGHTVHVRTLSSGVDIGARLGFTTDVIDPRIEAVEMDDWKASNPIAALKLSVAVFGRRAAHEVGDLTDAVAQVRPDALIVDVNCWGALSAGEAGDIPWASLSPYTPPLQSAGVPPFGLGLKPLSGPLGRVRDAVVRAVVLSRIEKVMLPPINAIRAEVDVAAATPPNATLCRMVPHGAILAHAVCAVTHGEMGATQKALARAVPVCVVPYGRDHSKWRGASR